MKPGRVQLGQSKLRISRVGIGTAPIGSTRNWHVFWGPQDETEAVKAIRTALDLGVNWIDTAPFYGWGRAEEIVGKAIEGRRDEVYIFTKCGTLPNGRSGSIENLTPENIRREVNASLRRLRTDHVDLLQFHDPDPTVPIEESWETVQELIHEGKVDYGGLSNHSVELLKRALSIGQVTSNQLQYNMLERTIEKEMMPFCQEHGIGILGWGSLAEGFLTDDFNVDKLHPDDFRRWHEYSLPENFRKILKLKSELVPVARKHDCTLVDVVVAWELAHEPLTAATIGIRNEEEAGKMLGGTNLHLDKDDFGSIEKALRTWEQG